MKTWSLFPGAGAACLLAAALGAGEKRAPARVYTDDDLARVSPRRGETGGESRPAAAAPAEKPDADKPEASGRGEAYWRTEAARVRQRVEPWREDADDLRSEIATRQGEPGVRPYTDAKVRALQRRLAQLEARIRDAEDRLEERARRAGALPGWLR